MNHAVGREVEIQVGPGEKRKKIYVAVGVPAGMWFALIATLRGHDVTPYEKRRSLGDVIIYHANCLHEGMANIRPNEVKAPLLQVFGLSCLTAHGWA